MGEGHFSTLVNARLWSCEEPNLYNAISSVESDGVTTDRGETPFGIRSIHFDANLGFMLNGKPVKVRGTCNHQDHAGVGAAVPDRLQQERVALLQSMDSNAYRTTHNPATPELLDACDRAGMLVMSETRTMASTLEGPTNWTVWSAATAIIPASCCGHSPMKSPIKAHKQERSSCLL